MSLNDNPFSSLVQSIREDNKSFMPAYYRLGTVSSVSPLRIDVAGNIQDNDSLLMNASISSFDIGDQLLLIPIEDEQRYIIVCKVVNI